jgi:peptidoglycan/LPS O-acetylase OafA/YrhL
LAATVSGSGIQAPLPVKPATSKSQYIPALDGLRGIAILLVISYHYFEKYTPLVHLGWSGVDLFFVLSGYLITKRLIETSGLPNRYALFYRNRALRIMPLYYLVLVAFYTGIYVLVSPQNIHRFDFYLQHKASYLFFLQNWLFVHSRPVEGHLIHLWSLGVEEQFYLVWPLFVYTFYKNKYFNQILWAIIIGVLLYRSVLYHFDNQARYYHHTLCRIDTMVCGALVYFVSSQKQTALFKWLGMAAAFIIMAGMLVFKTPESFSPFNTTIGYTAFAFLYAAVIYFAIHNPGSTAGSLLKNRALRFIGKISFGLYIFHIPVVVVCNERISSILQQLFHTPVSYVPEIICLMISFVLSVISYYYFESYFLKKKSSIPE